MYKRKTRKCQTPRTMLCTVTLPCQPALAPSTTVYPTRLSSPLRSRNPLSAKWTTAASSRGLASDSHVQMLVPPAARTTNVSSSPSWRTLSCGSTREAAARGVGVK
ncbi:hypothetical protein VTK73DRAFT_6269 [Phialemonium thermophilum]|uniref:Secreted protein n=1 Tax=Phialemonium thermophilum TaxID=223376 RepID=A0ABR3UZS4_9PEZI